MTQGRLSGFTIVEGLLVFIVLAAIVGAGMYFLRERERARLQAIAYSEPGKVFRVECEADRVEVVEGEMASFTARLFDTTKYTLEFPIYPPGECWLALANGKGEVEFVAAGRIVAVEGTPLEWDETPDPTPMAGNDVEVYSTIFIDCNEPLRAHAI